MYKATSALVTVSLALSAAPALAAVSFHPLGRTADADWIIPYAISGDGSTVVGQAFSNDRSYAVSWTASAGMIEVSGLPKGASFASGVSANGRTIVGSTGLGTTGSAFRWTSSSEPQFLPSAEPGQRSYVADVSGDGSEIVGFDELGPIRWSVNTSNVTTTRLPGPDTSSANAISRDGRVIVGGSSALGPALRWTDAGVAILPEADGVPTGVANGTNGDGSVVVGSLQNGQSFRWTVSEGTSALGVLPGDSYSSAIAVSDDGTLVMGNSLSESLGSIRAFVWSQSLGLIELKPFLESCGLDLSGWQDLIVYDLSGDGLTLTGSSLLNGVQEAWIAHIPTPGSILPVAMLAPLAARRRRSPHSVGR